MNYNVLVVVMLVMLAIVSIIGAFTHPPVRMAEVKNGNLALRHYYDYRPKAVVLTYFAEVRAGQPTGWLYAVELQGDKDFSRNRMVQFSSAGFRDYNPGTNVETVPHGSEEAERFEEQFAEVREKYDRQKWWERVSTFR